MTAPDPLPISLVAHTVFCPRRAWLESVGETVPSVAIEAGIADHARLDQRADPRSHRHRSVDVVSTELGLIGRCDVVLDSEGSLELVEYKSTPLRRKPIVTRPQTIQLALQRLCLEEAGHQVKSQSVYFTTHRKTVPVELDDDDFAAALDYVTETRTIVDGRDAPAPLVEDPRCARCSHLTICLPDQRDESIVPRRVAVTDPDGHVLHLGTPGSRAFLRQGRVRVVYGDEDLGDVPLESVAGLVVHGNVDLSSALVRELLWRRVSIVWCSGAGRVVGYASSAKTANGLPRVRQHVASAIGDIPLARELVAPKIANQATQLRRTSRHDVRAQVARLRALARDCSLASSVSELFGFEGEAAAVYFDALPLMLAAEGVDAFGARWPGRQGRAATEPMNVALNFCYGLLLTDMTRAVLACGLDPHAGFVHSSSRNKPALARWT